MLRSFKEIVKKIPHSSGCYKYYNKKGELIYVGKAKDLKKRVSSYFTGVNDSKTQVLVENITNIKWEITDSEIEALVLESLLIKKYKPRFNIKIKDDKDFLWVKIDLNQDFPYPELVRRPSVETNGRSSLQGKSPHIRSGVKFFGPFTDSKLLKQGLAVLRKIFLWRDCSASKFSFYKKKRKPCLEYQIKNCMGPCQASSRLVSSKQVSNKHDNSYQKGTISNRESLSISNQYQLGIKQLIAFFEGKKEKTAKDLKKEMEKLAKAKRFEEAGIIRDKLRALGHIDASLKIQKSKIKNQNDNSEFKILDKNQYLKNLIKKLNYDLGYNVKFKKDFRIEFYDISNISGKEATGSMVVWQGGGFAKDQYRKFKIKFVKGPNDVEMMREVLFRRIKKMSNFQFPISNQLQTSNDKFQNKDPDLVILDGGKPQLSGVAKLFQQLDVKIPLISLAKENEEIFGINHKLQITPLRSLNFEGQANNKQIPNIKFQKININKISPEGFFIQSIRDEAHRFAIGYHKILREKKMLSSRLDSIEGVGPKLKKKLLLKFGSVGGIMEARLDDVAGVIGKKLAIRIKENLK